MLWEQDIADKLHSRLRQPEEPGAVPGSLPVLFFGDLLTARVATLSLNPSPSEFVDKNGNELDGWDRRLETLHSLRAKSRATLDAVQCDRAISTMRGYFDPGLPVYWSYFGSLGRVLEGVGVAYWRREAVHLDLLKDATSLKWSAYLKEHPVEAQALLQQDMPFLLWQLTRFPIELVICNGKTSFEHLAHWLGVSHLESGKVARITWTLSRGHIGERDIAVFSWNLPLARPTGLSADGQRELGSLIRTKLCEHGLAPSVF